MGFGSSLSAISDTLHSLAQRYGLQTRLVEHRLQRDWPRIVGEQVAVHTRPDTIRYKKLYLIADHSVWVQQLQYLKPALLDKINAAAREPLVSDLVLRVGEVTADRPAPSPVGADVPSMTPSPEALQEADRHAQAIADPELRAQWASVMARALQRRPMVRKTPAP